MGTIKPKPAEGEQFPARNQSAFTNAFKWFYGKLVLYSTKIVRCYQKAKDTVSEVFTQLWENALSFKSVTDLRYWLYRSTRNASLNVYTRNRYDELRQNVIDSIFTDDQIQYKIQKERAIHQIALALTKLRRKDRTLFRLAYIKNLSNPVLAKRYKASQSAIASRKHHLLVSIRSHLNFKALQLE